MKNIIRFESKHNPEIDEKFHQLNIGNIGNVIYWWKFFGMIKNVKGDIVECGVGRGRSLLVLAAINQLLEQNEGGRRAIFAYDSFKGFPEPTTEDTSPRQPKQGEWSGSPSGKYKYSIDFTKQLLKEAGIPTEVINLKLSKGFFCDTLPLHPKQPIALLHIDGDLYQSYKDTLVSLYDLVAVGGLIVFDDFLAEPEQNESWPGARLAVKEFFSDKYSQLQVSERGTCYIVRS
jgi:O-methyltransferase